MGKGPGESIPTQCRHIALHRKAARESGCKININFSKLLFSDEI